MYASYRLSLFLAFKPREEIGELGDIVFGLMFVFLAIFVVSGAITVTMWIFRVVRKDESKISLEL